ncbi:MAG TPA: pitrilysin family protein [Planctomycetota bacterium]|nr:pitrilysin family protein [Planctomycetota bacterium]
MKNPSNGLGAIASLALLTFGAPATAADAPSEAKTVMDDGSGISETTWPNGLRLLVRRQPDNPMVTTMIWYAVGSRDEGVGETGLSHYLEHMLFKGTERYAVGEIDAITQANGGANNASTREDATEYHFSFPADRWEVALEIEADRMRNSTVQQAEFDLEKNVVLQELHSGLDDPATVMWQALEAAAFPVARYHHPVIGWQEDVETTTRERMMAYYRRHYTPDRATIVVVGGVDPARVIRRVDELFAAVPRGDVVRFEQKEPPALGETRLTLVQDTPVPRLVLAFRARKTLDPREPVLDVLAEILAGDKSTRLDRALVQTGIATQVAAWNDSRRDDGLFTIQAQPAEGHTLDEVEAGVRKVLVELAEKGPTEDEVRLARAKILASQVYQQESSMGLASRIGSMAAVGDWRYVLRYPKSVEATTAENVREEARGVFDLAKATVARSLPKSGGTGGGRGADEDDDEDDDGQDVRRAALRAGDKGARRARYREGTAAPAGAAAVADGPLDRALTLKPVRVVLPNGLTVIVLRRTQAAIFQARLSVQDGRLGEAAPGLDALAGSLLEEGTRLRGPEAIAQAIGAVGGTLAAGPGGAHLKTLSKDAATGLGLLAEVVTQPAFKAEDLGRAKARQLAALAEDLETPRALVSENFRRAVYGPDHPLGRNPRGTPESIRAATRDAVQAHHARFWVPRNATLAIVSDLDPAYVVARVEEAFGGWKGGERPNVDSGATPELRATRIATALDRTQTNLILGHLGVTRTDPDFVALEAFDNVFGLGSGFTSRLAKSVRDTRGLAYSVYGTISTSATTLPGYFVMYAATNPKDAAKATALMREELAAVLGDRPPTAQELTGAKAALRGEMVSSCETGAGLLGVLHLCERYGLGFDYPHRYLHALESLTVEEVVAAARRHVFPDRLLEVVVGREEK